MANNGAGIFSWVSNLELINVTVVSNEWRFSDQITGAIDASQSTINISNSINIDS